VRKVSEPRFDGAFLLFEPGDDAAAIAVEKTRPAKSGMLQVGVCQLSGGFSSGLPGIEIPVCHSPGTCISDRLLSPWF
jgi:hypothetical protein